MPRLARAALHGAAVVVLVAQHAAPSRAQCAVVPGANFGVPGFAPGVLSEVMRMRHWDPDGAGPQPPLVLMAGTFPAAGAAGGSNLAAWDPRTNVWTPIGQRTFGRGQSCAILANGDLAVSAFDFGAGQGTVARWDGSNWTQLGGGFDSQVIALTATPNGDLYVGGYFTTYNGNPMSSCARWDGQQWQQVGQGLPLVDELVTMPDGDVVAGHYNGASRWNGTAWIDLGATFVGFCTALEVLPNGDLLAGGLYGGLGRWDGTTWTVVRTVSATNSFRFEAVTELPNGDLLGAGQFIQVVQGSPNATDIASRWDGSDWRILGLAPAGGTTFCLLGLDNGDVLLGGAFGTPQKGNSVAVGVVQLTTSCPASVAALGTGCANSAGVASLATDIPWTGSVWTATANGLPASAIALVVHGFAPATTPLVAVLPQAGPGCELLVQPDHVSLAATAAGAASAAFAIPNAPHLAGAVFHHQMIVLEHDASLTIVGASATDAVTLTIGTF